MKLKKIITAAAYTGDIQIVVVLNSDGLLRNEARQKMDELTGEIMRTVSIEARVPLSRIRIK
jgi:hypothetical protein